jgi:hypothetical protein
VLHDFLYKYGVLAQADFVETDFIGLLKGIKENAVPLPAFLDIPEEKACTIAATDHLFSD